MSGRSPRFISVIRDVHVSLVGVINDDYAYVTIRGTKYYKEAELKIPQDSTIFVYVDSEKTSVRTNCYVTLNGEKVKSGYGTYSYFAKAGEKLTLTFTRISTYDPEGDAPYYYMCEIATS